MNASVAAREIERDSRPPAPRGWKLEPWELAALAGILVATAIVYMPSIRYGFVWDDSAQIVGRSPLQSWAGIGKSFIYDSWWFRDPDHLPQSAYYRPLQAAWFGLNSMMLGLHPAAWHLEKIAIELIGVIVCFRLAQLLTRDTRIALLAAAIFALIPANVESVVWNSAIGEPLSTIFEMGAMCCFIQRKPGRGLSRGLIFASILYAGALLSHETAVLFWLVIAAYIFLIEGKRPGESIRLAAPFMLLGVAYLGARLYALGTVFFGQHYFVPGTVASGWEAPHPPHGLLDIILTAPVALLTYVEVLVLPGMAGPAHDVNWTTGASVASLVSAGLLVALAAIALALIRRSRDRNLYFFCAAWSLIAIAPSMNLKALVALVQDRLLYAPSFGWSLALAVAAMRLASAPRARAPVAGAMALLLAAYAVTIVRVERDWHDDRIFWTSCVAIAPHKADYLRELVDVLNKKGDLTAAMEVLRQAVNRDPDNEYLHTKLAKQYATMQRGAEFAAEIVKVRALRARAGAARAAAANARGANPVPSPR
ncbi:MAG: tetratricopeptide repeat protein [Candidatus Binatus sp.]